LEGQADAAFTDAVAASKSYTDTKTIDSGWVTAGFTLSTGITNNQTISARRVGNVVSVMATSLTVDSLSISTTGDIPNRSLFTVPSAFMPSVSGQGLASAQSGRVGSFYINSDGQVFLAATVPDSTQTGTVATTAVSVSVAGTYLI
jgi:hypothetical protein